MSETRPSAELISAGHLPPCQIDDDNGAPVLGGRCEGVTPVADRVRRVDHASCPGWWRDTTAPPHRAQGFRCACECHGAGNGWPGWDRFLSGNDPRP